MATAVTLIVYGLIAAAGGVVGYRKAASRASRGAGIGAGSVLAFSGVLVLFDIQWGVYLGFAATLGVFVMFWGRYRKTGAMMPAGLMLAVSSIVAGILFTQIFQ